MESTEQTIGAAAGNVYSTLKGNGAMTAEQIRETTELGEPLAQQAIGWLAREGKIAFAEAEKDETTFTLTD